MTKMIAAWCACMTFTGLQAHGSLGTMRKALELDRRKGGLSYEKGQTEKRKKRKNGLIPVPPLLPSGPAPRTCRLSLTQISEPAVHCA
jgi:hypothetical protein